MNATSHQLYCLRHATLQTRPMKARIRAPPMWHLVIDVDARRRHWWNTGPVTPPTPWREYTLWRPNIQRIQVVCCPAFVIGALSTAGDVFASCLGANMDGGSGKRQCWSLSTRKCWWWSNIQQHIPFCIGVCIVC
jgi:hypothetical protein